MKKTLQFYIHKQKMYSTIDKTKWGDCCQCSAKETNVVKVGKNKYCLQCHQNNKNKVQLKKASVKQQVRGLIKYERAEGILDSISELKLDADRVVSRYIRLRDMEKDGKITCYCCKKRVDWKKSHCMHFVNRANMATRYLIANLHSGCFECNVEKRGNLQVYAENLELETPGIVEWLQEQGRSVHDVSQSELKELLYDLQQKLNLVEKKLK